MTTKQSPKRREAAPAKPLIGLVMIVKNEQTVLPRLFESVLSLVDTYTIVDTGSSDRTVEYVKKGLADIPGKVLQHKWQNYGRNRTLAYRAAIDSATWLLQLDADFTIEAHPRLREWLAGDPDPSVDAWNVELEDHGLRWRLPWLVRGCLEWKMKGVVHETLDVTDRVTRDLTGLTLHHHGDGGNQRGKLDAWIELLEPDFRKRDPRAVFYTAECHRYAGRLEQAALIYDLRAELDGWDEERWYAIYQAAACRRDLNGLYEAWQARPWRHEPLTAMARIVGAAPKMGDHLFLEQPPA